VLKSPRNRTVSQGLTLQKFITDQPTDANKSALMSKCRSVRLHRMNNSRSYVDRYSLARKPIWPCCDLDLQPWKPFQQRALTCQIFVASSIEIPSLLPREAGVNTDRQTTSARNASHCRLLVAETKKNKSDRGKND